MYYSKEQLERMRKQAEETFKKMEKKMEEEKKGHKFKSEADLDIICLHCRHDRFEKGNALLNTRGLTFFDLEWLNDSATTLMCKRCGLIHWFGKEVREIKEDPSL